MERLPDSSLIIGVATSTAERVQLARLLGGADALLLVSSAEQARAFLDLTTACDSTPVVLTPTVLPTASRGAVTAQIESPLPTSGPHPGTRPAVVAAPPAVVAGPPVAVAGPPVAVAGPPAAVAGPPAAVAAVPAADEALRLDEDRRVARWKDREIPLTRLEHDFLHCLVKEPGQVWTYQRLHHAVWGNEHLGHGSHIHSVVKRLRQKLAELGASVTIHAVRGVGFHLLPAA
ncbi:transcriptional regulator [Kribbella orskensis]|uniref:Transcriptional regulator n=1 Tax=Kribbella orskensis TaxID=2512216 RepID=A0ABY2B9I6_9ACTN|nr:MULTISPECIES: winged helix-turn-helix domain-containing protein [Kribbella]TCN32246.1 transcriptional regulator [Kribbella sp. VKM Ac-2500]TCO12659.1 transcriptional regulator [Kribbella orskensis]